MKKPHKKHEGIAFILLCLLLLSSSVFSEDSSLGNTQNLVRNLMCILLWVMPFIILLFFIAGGYLILSGNASGRSTGKR